MSTAQKGFTVSAKLPLKLSYYFRKPSHYSSNSNSIVISTNYIDSNPGIFEYNLDSNKLELLQKYNSITNKPEEHGQFIDDKNGKLYIFGGDNDSFFTLDLNKKIMVEGEHNDDFNEEIKRCSIYPNAVSVSSPSTNCKVHILAKNGMHFIFDCKENVFTKIDNDPFDVSFSKLLYNESTKKLFILGGNYNDSIWEYDIEQKWALNTWH
eukprot:105294_1